MQSLPVKTRVFKLGQDLLSFLIEELSNQDLQNGDVVALTSKVVSLAEGRVVSPEKITDKEQLIRAEADVYIGKGAYNCHLTIKHNILIPSAGIDESNSAQGDYILFPEDPFASAENIHRGLSRAFQLEKLGVLITDSHTTPLRRGVTGIALAHYGFKGVRSLIGEKDIYSRPLQFTYVNHADALAVMAVYEMGEAAEQIPLVILRGRRDLEFSEHDPRGDCRIPVEDDLYLPLLANRSRNG
jgi:coenzyme F420-0:L-glutamate ligase